MARFIEQFKKEIENFKPAARKEGQGVVVRVGDGVAEIEGLEGALMSEMLVFDTAHGKNLKEALKDTREVVGVVLNLEESSVRAIILGDTARVEEGMLVSTTGKVLSIPASKP